MEVKTEMVLSYPKAGNVNFKDTATTMNINELPMLIKGTSGFNDPLYIIDGKPVIGVSSETLDVSSVKSVNILKDATSTALYGDKGKNGVIIITTKEGAKAKPEKINIKAASETSDKHLYILDGKEITESQFKDIDQSKLESVQIYKDKVYTNKYGEKGLNGVIIMTTKPKK